MRPAPVAALILAIDLAIVGGCLRLLRPRMGSWVTNVLAAALLAIILLEVTLLLLRHPWAAVGAAPLAVVFLCWLAREPVQGWLAAARGDGVARRIMNRKRRFIYLGRRMGRWVCAHPEHAVLVLGPPRQGKTAAIVIPTLLAASGPVVATSTKEDVLLKTASTRRQVGRCWLFDPSGTAMPSPTIELLRWAPVQGCATWDGAVVMAHSIVATSRPAEGVRDAGHWSERAEALLAPLLHAAALDGLPMRQVMTWVLGQDDEEPQEILDRHDALLPAVTLAGVGRSAATERAGIWSTTAGALAAYRSHAALAVTDGPNFDPHRFVRSRDTVYIAAPGRFQRVTAPLVVGLLEEIRSASYQLANEHARTDAGPRPPVLWLLDEVANIAPLPELPSIVSEGGGQGLIVLACLQDLSQARERWGERAEGFLSLFGTKVIFRGLGDIRTLQAISSLAGDHEVKKVSTQRPARLRWWSSSGRTRSYSPQREPRLPVDKIALGEPGKALLFQTGKPLTWIRLTYYFRSQPWKSLVAAADDARLRPRQPRVEPPVRSRA